MHSKLRTKNFKQRLVPSNRCKMIFLYFQDFNSISLDFFLLLIFMDKLHTYSMNFLNLKEKEVSVEF